MTSWKQRLSETTAKLRDLSKDADRVEQMAAKRDINVYVKGGEVYIDAPPGTYINCECWYDSLTKMSERIQMGTDESAAFIREYQELQARLDRLEKKLGD